MSKTIDLRKITSKAIKEQPSDLKAVCASGLKTITYEMDRLLSLARNDGLTDRQTKSLTDLVRAADQLANLEERLKKRDAVSRMTDEEIDREIERLFNTKTAAPPKETRDNDRDRDTN